MTILADEQIAALAAEIARRLEDSRWYTKRKWLEELPFRATKFEELRSRGLLPEPLQVGRYHVWTGAQVREWRERVERGELVLTTPARRLELVGVRSTVAIDDPKVRGSRQNRRGAS